MANFIERLLNGEKKTLHKLEKIADAVIALQDSDVYKRQGGSL